MKALKKLAVVCGGTGGHFYPGLSIARTFRQSSPSDHEVLLLLSGKHVVAQSATATNFDLPSVIIPASQRPGNPIRAIKFFWSLSSGILKALKALSTFKPDALLAMGSFASVPSVVAARLLGIPVYLHDGNARLGKANLLFSRIARHLGTAFPPVNADHAHCPWSCTGMPIRLELLNSQQAKSTAIDELNRHYQACLDSNKPTLLIFGGSQGARTINTIFPQAISKLTTKSLQVIHLTGKDNSESVKQYYSNSPVNILVLESTAHMHLMYSAADFVICRSGGSTVAELAFFGKYACLIPFPFAADKHQDDNANYYQSNQGGTVLQNSDLTEARATFLLSDWLKNVEAYRQQGLKAGRAAKPNAADDILELIANDLATA